MYAYKKPFTETLVLELEPDEVLSLHGRVLVLQAVADTFLSILEAFNAGTDMSRFDRPSEPTETEA